MATIKELVEREIEDFEKAQELKRSLEKMETQMRATHEIAKEVKQTP